MVLLTPPPDPESRSWNGCDVLCCCSDGGERGNASGGGGGPGTRWEQGCPSPRPSQGFLHYCDFACSIASTVFTD